VAVLAAQVSVVKAITVAKKALLLAVVAAVLVVLAQMVLVRQVETVEPLPQTPTRELPSHTVAVVAAVLTVTETVEQVERTLVTAEVPTLAVEQTEPLIVVAVAVAHLTTTDSVVVRVVS